LNKSSQELIEQRPTSERSVDSDPSNWKLSFSSSKMIYKSSSAKLTVLSGKINSLFGLIRINFINPFIISSNSPKTPRFYASSCLPSLSREIIYYFNTQLSRNRQSELIYSPE